VDSSGLSDANTGRCDEARLRDAEFGPMVERCRETAGEMSRTDGGEEAWLAAGGGVEMGQFVSLLTFWALSRGPPPARDHPPPAPTVPAHPVLRVSVTP
jgi:hypothetical protein